VQIDHYSKIPLHFQVEQLLRELIEKPNYQAGEFLPPEVELATKLGVSRNTIRQAASKLEYEGLIVRKKGYGTKVAEKSLITKLNSWHSWTHEMKDKGISFKNYCLEANFIDSPEKISDFFKIPINTTILKLTRLRGDEKGPYVYFESYFHPRIGVAENDDFTQPLYEMLEQKYNIHVSISREKIKARIATKITADRLIIKPGEPVLIRERFVSDNENLPVEYNIGFYIAEKFTYLIEIRR